MTALHAANDAGVAMSITDAAISTVVLYELAVAQPLLDVLGSNAEFYIARGEPRAEILTTAIVIALVIPLVLAALVAAAIKLSARVGRAVHLVVLGGLGALLAEQFISHTPAADLPWGGELALAAALGVLLAFAYHRFEPLRWVTRFGIVMPVLFIALFLFASPASKLVHGASAAEVLDVSVGNPAPVVMLVFDEFPVASLMDEHGELQSDLYPNFARLAEDGTWYRNAVTVQQQTVAAVPAILTGLDPEPDQLPVAFDHPNSLFSALSGTYDVTAIEPVTELCPSYACTDRAEPAVPTGDRMRSLVSDVSIIAGHVLLPDDLAAELPSIDNSWSNFADQAPSEDFNIVTRFNEQVREDRRIAVDTFVEGLDAPPADKPTLRFMHVLYPHFPWNHLPSGQTYPIPVPDPAAVTTGWGDDEWLIDQTYAQHLLQVQYVDTLLGRVIQQLEAAGTYDDTLLVVVADHGIVVRPNIVHRRVVVPDTVGEVAAIPLFIKRPHQAVGGIDDYRALTVDVLPTMADALDITLPWATDGVSLDAPERPVRTTSQTTGYEGVITYGVDGSEARAAAARKIAHIGPDGPYGLTPPGQRDLLGTPTDGLDILPAQELAGTISNAGNFVAVDLDATRLPAQVLGTVDGEGDGDLVLAVVVDGEIAAVTRTYVDEDGERAFHALIPPSVLVPGQNDVELLLVDGTGPGRRLHQL